MLFNSYIFLFAFLPAALVGFFTLGRFGKGVGAAWLAACSLLFYAWWDYRYILLLSGSICFNYLIGTFIARHHGSIEARRALMLALAANLLLLGYYKYADFFIDSTNAILATEWPALGIILPIGISFFTFTQIAFLVDAYAGKVTEYRFVYYVLFVTYFPHLIAGPVLHHREMIPQFDENDKYRPHAADFAVGLTIFSIGLAKKVLIADNLAVHASPLFSPGAEDATLFLAWSGVLAYSFQLYFDFSGYSDMAIGISRLFGVRLPINFDSPYKSRDIAEFWRRWHMTLSRFLRDYLYIPLGGNRHGPKRRHANLIITMALGGLWHGAGWNFVIWGLAHGSFLVCHQIWRTLRAKIPFTLPSRVAAFLGTSLTFLCVVFAWVYFRAPDLETANRIVLGMLGGFGAALPESVLARLGPLAAGAHLLGIETYLGGGSSFVESWCWVIAAAVIAFVAPNTQELMRDFEPALPCQSRSGSRTPGPAWRPGRAQAMTAGLLATLSILALGRPTEFLYFQF